MGHAILGDPVYLKKPVSPFIPTSLCLHAYYISFIHPLTHSKIEAYAKLPSDFKEALKSLIPHAKLPRY
jgi:23S rRNA-/tRNA-specific pseudouridylate synthase